ncbi:MAG TPA: hypothetical protein P5138_06310 [Solirubrobacterales bacterium]|nr:hypothetical protein [Solirubrobacterales bacterium]
MTETVETSTSRRAKQRAMMIAVDQTGEATLSELGELLKTAGVATVGEVIQRRSEPDPDRYFGRGKLEEVKEEVGRTGANLVAAIRLGQRLGPEATVVTVMCDTGIKYISTALYAA